MTGHPTLTLDLLQRAVAGEAAAIRCVTRLQPAGGAGDKLFPPTFATGERKLKYAIETRKIAGAAVETVLLDSVASQANRMEEALYAGWEARLLDFPVISVDFSNEKEIADLDRLTTLQAPHRIADALLRDSVTVDNVAFRQTEAGQAFTEATVTRATAVYRYCPTALIFGVWDSTGPKGGLGNKFPRLLVSEIIGVGAQAGAKVGSRLDPMRIEGKVQVFKRRDNPDDWTIEPSEALLEKGKPVLFSRKGGDGKQGTPSAINHSNVVPTIDLFAGGVTIDYAQQTTVLSLPALRRLRFPTTVDGKRLEGQARLHAEHLARTALAALALAAVAAQWKVGFDLRSRCTLVPEPGGPLVFEILPHDGGEPERCTLDVGAAAALLNEAASRAREFGFGWEREPVKLLPSKKLAELVRRSRELASRGEVDEGNG